MHLTPYKKVLKIQLVGEKTMLHIKVSIDFSLHHMFVCFLYHVTGFS